MPIEFVCDKCGASLARPYVSAGKATSCDACGIAITVPRDYGPKDFDAKPLARSKSPAVVRNASAIEATVLDGTGASPAIRPGASPPADGEDSQRSRLRLADLLRFGRTGSSAWERTDIFTAHVFAQSYALFRSRLGTYVRGYWVLMLAFYGPRRLLEFVSARAGDPDSPIAVRTIVFVAGVLLYVVSTAWLSSAGFTFMLKTTRGEDASLVGALRDTKHVMRMMALMLPLEAVVVLIFGLSALPAVAVWFASHDPRWTILTAATFTLPAFVGLVWLSLIYSQAPFLIVDRGLGPLESLAASARLMEGNCLEIFLISLAVAATPAAILACGVGILIAMPFGAVMMTVAYLQLTGYWLDESEGCMRPLQEIPPRRASAESQLYRAPARPRRRLGWVGLLAIWLVLFAAAGGAYFGYEWWTMKRAMERARLNLSEMSRTSMLRSSLARALSTSELSISVSDVVYGKPIQRNQRITGIVMEAGRSPRRFVCHMCDGYPIYIHFY